MMTSFYFVRLHQLRSEIIPINKKLRAAAETKSRLDLKARSGLGPQYKRSKLEFGWIFKYLEELFSGTYSILPILQERTCFNFKI